MSNPQGTPVQLMLRLSLPVLCLLAVVLISSADIRTRSVSAQTTVSTALEDREFIGTQSCTGCHQAAGNQWAHSVHDLAFATLDTGQWDEPAGCESCHGPGSDHAANPAQADTIIRFTVNSPFPVAEQNQVCMGCHQGEQRIHWAGSIHDRSDVACADCHNPMATLSVSGMLAAENVNQTCFGCHQTQRAEFSRRSHMPLAEGALSCVDCHQPHGSLTAPLLQATSVNETCYGCHADKRGPFLFEHAPVRESCANCHTPHGSNHESLLATPRPLLCQQCHTMIGHMNDLMTRGSLPTGAAPDARLVGRSCQNCHVQIHGSNHPSGADFHR